MPYIEIQLPSGTSAQVEQMIRGLIDPLLRDVHAMLRLPQAQISGLEARCNLSVAMVLLAAVSGISVELYTNAAIPNDRSHRGRRFKQLLVDHFPWSDEPQAPDVLRGADAAEVLYEFFRNPLTHALGKYDGTPTGDLKVAKGPEPLDEAELCAIERAAARPQWEGWPTLRQQRSPDGQIEKTVLLPKSLYWGVRQLVVSVVRSQLAAGHQGPQPTAVTLRSTAASVSGIGPSQVGSMST